MDIDSIFSLINDTSNTNIEDQHIEKLSDDYVNVGMFIKLSQNYKNYIKYIKNSHPDLKESQIENLILNRIYLYLIQIDFNKKLFNNNIEEYIIKKTNKLIKYYESIEDFNKCYNLNKIKKEINEK